MTGDPKLSGMRARRATRDEPLFALQRESSLSEVELKGKNFG